MSCRPAAAALEVCVTASASASVPAEAVEAVTTRSPEVFAATRAPVAVSLALFAVVATRSESWKAASVVSVLTKASVWSARTSPLRTLPKASTRLVTADCA